MNKALSDAYKAPTAKAAQTRVTALAKQLLDEHPDAAGSLKEGLSELFTVKALALPKALEKALSRVSTKSGECHWWRSKLCGDAATHKAFEAGFRRSGEVSRGTRPPNPKTASKALCVAAITLSPRCR